MVPAGRPAWARPLHPGQASFPLPGVGAVGAALLRVPAAVSGEGQVKLFADSEGVTPTEGLSPLHPRTWPQQRF